MSNLKVAASTFPYIYSHTGIDAVNHLMSMGYKAIEMVVFPPHCWPADMTLAERRAIHARLKDNGAQVTSMCYPLLDNNPNGVDSRMRRYTIDRYKEIIELAHQWGCPYVCAIPGPVNSLINPPYKWMRDWFIEGMKELVAFSKNSGVGIVLENVPFTFLPTIDDMVAVANDIDPSVGINFDVCNSAYIREDYGALIRKLGPKVKNVHISDSGYGEFKHDRLGTGIVDPAPAGKALLDTGYTGYSVLEIIADAVNPKNDPDGDILVSHDILAQHGWEKRTKR